MTRNLPSRRYEMPPPKPRGLGSLALAYLVLLALVLGVIAWAVAATPGAVRTTARLSIPPRSIELPEPAMPRETAVDEEIAAPPGDGDAPGGTADADAADAADTTEPAGTAESAETDANAETAESTEADETAAAGPVPAPVPRPADEAGAEAATTETAAAPTGESAGDQASADQAPAADTPEPPASTDVAGNGPTEVPETAPDSAAAAAAGSEDDTDTAGAGDTAGEDAAAAPQTALAPPAPPGQEIELATVDPALSEAGANGPLPVIAPDGRSPWQTYRRPYRAAPDRPVIALMVSGLGLSSGPTQAAIQDLPPQISLAFMPYAENLDEWVSFARAAGHEVFVNVPMEPYNYPANDPGPQALLTSLSAQENRERLRWTLSRFTGYVGVTNYMGSLFTTQTEPMQPVIEELKARGLMFFDSWPSRTSVVPELAGEAGLAYASSVGFVDLSSSTAAIRGRLEEVEEIARETGYAAAIGLAFPLTIEVLGDWSRGLEARGITLVPVSAMVEYER